MSLFVEDSFIKQFQKSAGILIDIPFIRLQIIRLKSSRCSDCHKIIFSNTK